MHGFSHNYSALGTLKTYQIDLKKLLLSEYYEFDYILGDDFFESVDGTEVRQGKVSVSLNIIRTSSAFELDFDIEGVVTVVCDRCLDNFEIPVEATNKLIVTFGEEYTEVSDEHVIVSEEEGFIDIAWYMYEFIALAIPMKHIHEAGKCNEVMTSKLKGLCVEEAGNSNVSESTDGSRQTDPRWDALRNLVGDN